MNTKEMPTKQKSLPHGEKKSGGGETLSQKGLATLWGNIILLDNLTQKPVLVKKILLGTHTLTSKDWENLEKDFKQAMFRLEFWLTRIHELKPLLSSQKDLSSFSLLKTFTTQKNETKLAFQKILLSLKNF